MNVKIVKLINSEEILCDLVSQDDENVTVKNPTLLVPHNNSVAMVPYMPFADYEKGLTIPSSQVMFVVDVREEVVKQFEQQFNPLVTPSNKIVSAGGPVGNATVTHPSGPLGLAH